jgi:hypothetical protein
VRATALVPAAATVGGVAGSGTLGAAECFPPMPQRQAGSCCTQTALHAIGRRIRADLQHGHGGLRGGRRIQEGDHHDGDKNSRSRLPFESRLCRRTPS